MAGKESVPFAVELGERIKPTDALLFIEHSEWRQPHFKFPSIRESTKRCAWKDEDLGALIMPIKTVVFASDEQGSMLIKHTPQLQRKADDPSHKLTIYRGGNITRIHEGNSFYYEMTGDRIERRRFERSGIQKFDNYIFRCIFAG